MVATKKKSHVKETMNALTMYACHGCVDTVGKMNCVLKEFAFQQLLNHHKFAMAIMAATLQKKFAHGTIAETNVRTIKYASAKLPKSALLVNIVIREPANEVTAAKLIRIATIAWIVKTGYAFQNEAVTETMIANQTGKYVRIAYACRFNNHHAKMTLIVMAASFVTMESAPNADTITNVLLHIFVV